MSSVESAEADSDIFCRVFHGDRHSCTVIDGAPGPSYLLDSPKAVKQDQLDTSILTAFNTSGQSVRSRATQRPPRKRQKVLQSNPFYFQSFQPNNLQDFKVSSSERSISNELVIPQSAQGIQEEWPKRGRTNICGQALIPSQDSSPLRSQSPFFYTDRDTMGHPSDNTINLPKSGSRSRSTSPIKGKQALRRDGMQTPAVESHLFPQSIQNYLRESNDQLDRFIPSSLQTTIAKGYDEDSSFHYHDVFGNIKRDLSAKLYYDLRLEGSERQSIIHNFDTLMHIQEEADECQTESGDENAWCFRVVWPLLHRALHKPESSKLKVASVQSQKINTKFSIPEVADDLAQKSIDFAFFVNPKSNDAVVVALYKALEQRIPEISRGLWIHPNTAKLIPTLILEVKVERPDEGEFQLMTAARAFLKYLEFLLEQSALNADSKASLLERLPPAVGWIVHQNEWKFYVSYRAGPKHWHFCENWVSLPRFDGKTSSKGGALRLLLIIEVLKTYFVQKYISWLKDVLLSEEAQV